MRAEWCVHNAHAITFIWWCWCCYFGIFCVCVYRVHDQNARMYHGIAIKHFSPSIANSFNTLECVAIEHLAKNDCEPYFWYHHITYWVGKSSLLLLFGSRNWTWTFIIHEWIFILYDIPSMQHWIIYGAYMRCICILIKWTLIDDVAEYCSYIDEFRAMPSGSNTWENVNANVEHKFSLIRIGMPTSERASEREIGAERKW